MPKKIASDDLVVHVNADKITAVLKFGRTISPAPYESIRADIELPFSYIEGDLASQNGAVASAVNNVRVIIESLIGAGQAPVAHVSAAVASPKTPAPTRKAPVEAKVDKPAAPAPAVSVAPDKGSSPVPQQLAQDEITEGQMHDRCTTRRGEGVPAETIRSIIGKFVPEGLVGIRNIPSELRKDFLEALNIA